MKRKGFTLVELLVVIAIIALLMGILMPALAMVRSLAQRVICGSNLSSAGKAIMLYAGEYRGKYPRAGKQYSYWDDHVLDWRGGFGTPGGVSNEDYAYGPDPTSPAEGNPASIGSCLYLLIKYADATPDAFICGGDGSAEKFNLNPGEILNSDYTEAWDFGANPRNHYSYAYHCPFGNVGESYYPLTQLSDSAMAIMADKNPYIVNRQDADWQQYIFEEGIVGGSRETEKFGNSPNHARDGQNVLYNDFHVEFAVVPYCGLDDDNIYSMTRQVPGGQLSPYSEVGYEPWSSFGVYHTNIRPGSRKDSLLLNEGAILEIEGFNYIIKKTPLK